MLENMLKQSTKLYPLNATLTRRMRATMIIQRFKSEF